MSIHHGKQYKNKIEAMTNTRISELNNEITDVSNSITNLNITTKNMLEVPFQKIAFFNERNNLMTNDTNIYAGNNFKDICNNYFNVNAKGVIKQYDNPSNDIKNSSDDTHFNGINLTSLNPYEVIKVGIDNVIDTDYNLIKGTNIQQGQTTGYEGKHVFSNRLINEVNDVSGNNNNNATCRILKTGETFSSEATFPNVSSRLECKQLAIDNFYKHYILQKDADGSFNCHLFNNQNLIQNYDISDNACDTIKINNDEFKIGLSVNDSYSFYNNKQVGNKDNYRQGGFIDFDSNFVRQKLNTNNFKIDNSKTTIIQNRTFDSLGVEISCNLLENDDTIVGYVKDNNNNKCYNVSNDLLLDPTQRKYNTNYNIIMKDKVYTEGFENQVVNSHRLSRFNEVVNPTFTIDDILKDELQAFPGVKDEIIAQTNLITENNLKIFEELEKYNRILREANLSISEDITRNMNYVSDIEDNLDPNLDDSLTHKKYKTNVGELRRKLDDQKLVLNYSHNNYILWTLLGVASLIVLLKVSKPNNNNV
jgi:hypothetical protein